ncbi:MAG: UPF0262 family protein [Pseudomonadota bacterium]
MTDEPDFADGDHYIAELYIDDASLPVTSMEMQHERRVAIFDLIEDNQFKPMESPGGPYMVRLALDEGQRLQFTVDSTLGMPRGSFSVSMVPFRRIVKDYFMICESYHNAIRTATSAQIEAIDMGRRGLHNEGSRLLADSLRNNAALSFDTSRRLFTLICALHRRPT